MHPCVTKSCGLLAATLVAAALIGSAGGAQAVECRSEKGAGFPWSWRQIDGKQCWYKGKPGMDKKLLSWADSTPAPKAPRPRPRPSVAAENTAEREELLHSYWPLLPQADVFGDRFDVRGQR
jgi:hypothetical protein